MKTTREFWRGVLLFLAAAAIIAMLYIASEGYEAVATQSLNLTGDTARPAPAAAVRLVR